MPYIYTKDHNNQVNSQKPTQPHQTKTRSPTQNMDSTTTTPTTTTSPGSKTTHFSLFNVLPLELRKQIWTTVLLTPLTPSCNNKAPDTRRPLYIRPFTTLEPGYPDNNLADLESEDSPDSVNDPPLPPLIPDQTAENAKSAALGRAARFHILDTMGRINMPGTPLGTAGRDSGWLVKKEVDRIAGSCREAKEAYTDLRRWLGPPEKWVDLRDGVCCF